MKKNIFVFLFIAMLILSMFLFTSCNSADIVGTFYYVNNNCLEPSTFFRFEKENNNLYCVDETNTKVLCSNWSGHHAEFRMTLNQHINGIYVDYLYYKCDLDGKKLTATITLSNYTLEPIVFYKSDYKPDDLYYHIYYYDPLTESLIGEDKFNKIRSLPTLQDENKYFEGWYYTPFYLVKATQDQKINDQIILYAKWSDLTEDNSVSVSYETNCDVVVEPTIAPKGGKVKTPTPEREGYLFDGWFIDSGLEKPFDKTATEDVTVYARWERMVRARYISRGEVLQEEVIRQGYNSPYRGEMPTDYEEDGVKYYCYGWDNDDITIRDDIDIHAIYRPREKGEDGFYYVLSKEGDYYCICGNDFTGTELIAPEEFNNLPVKRIKAGGLTCQTATKIVIPDCIEYVEEGALSGCVNLKSLTTPFIGDKRTDENETIINTLGYMFGTNEVEGITSTQQYVWGSKVNPNFSSMPFSGVNYYIPNDLEEIVVTDSDYIPIFAFKNCASLIKVDIKKRTRIGSSAFSSCQNLKDVTLPESLTELGSSAFEYCESLESIKIPESITRFEAGLFYGCKSLTSLTIPANLKYIGGNCFYLCVQMTSIVLPETLESIGRNAFWSSGIITIDVPSNVKEIEGGAFWRDNLKYILISTKIETIGYSITGNKAKILCKDGNSFGYDAYKYLGPYEEQIYYYSKRKADETRKGRWWYYDDDGQIVTVVI